MGMAPTVKQGNSQAISNTDWSWAALMADYDNDGWKDIFVTNGYLRDYTNQDFLFYMNNYVKEKGRLKREDVLEIVKEMPSSNVSKLYIFTTPKREVSKIKAMTGASISHPTVMERYMPTWIMTETWNLVVNNINQSAFIYQNEAQKTNDNNFLNVRQAGEAGNTFGLGASVKNICFGTDPGTATESSKGLSILCIADASLRTWEP
jgi:hypothetical protein